MMTTGSGRARIVSIGLSRFADDAVRPLPFAAADARAFAAGVGPSATARTLTDAAATADAIHEAFAGLSAVEPENAVYVFAVSHAAASEGDVLLSGFDGPVSLGETLRGVWDGPATRVVLLFDLHRGGVGEDRPATGDLVALFPPRPGRTLLLSDDGMNGSHVSGELQAGIWAAHVTAAFSGESPRGREVDGTLTARSLRSFLGEEVSRSLARAYTDGRRQSPVVLAATDDEVLAEPVEAGEAESTSEPPSAGLRFFTDREVPVKALGGFRKSLHTPPSDTLASSREWVARLAEPDLAKEIEETVARLRRHLGYKRRDVRADGPAGGAASVLTPDFSYHVTARQHPERPSQAVFRRTLDGIRNFDVLGRSAFAEAFPQGFLSLQQPFEIPADVEALIDAIEDAEPPGIVRINYPTDLAYCELELVRFEGRVRIERGGLTVTAAGPAAPAELAVQFALVRRLLRGT